MPLYIASHVIYDPMTIWRKYAHNHARTIREYDLADPGDPNILTSDEAWTSRIVSSRLTYTERDQLVRRAADASAPWTRVPAGADLADADPTVPGGLFADAARLYWWFTWPERIHGVRVAKVHKILHFKRPGLYPILDDHLRTLYQSFAPAWVEPLSHLGEVTSADSPPHWAAFQKDLVRNHDELKGRKDELARDGDEAVALMAKLTCLRLQDIIAWSIGDPGDKESATLAR